MGSYYLLRQRTDASKWGGFIRVVQTFLKPWAKFFNWWKCRHFDCHNNGIDKGTNIALHLKEKQKKRQIKYLSTEIQVTRKSRRPAPSSSYVQAYDLHVPHECMMSGSPELCQGEPRHFHHLILCTKAYSDY